MKAHRVMKDTGLPIYNLGAMWKWVINFMPQWLYSWEINLLPI